MNIKIKEKTNQNMIKLQDDKLTIEKNIKAIELNSKLEEKKRNDYTRDRLDDLKLKESKIKYDKEFKAKEVEEEKRLMYEYTVVSLSISVFEYQS